VRLGGVGIVRIVVLGGTGFVGRAVVADLEIQGHEVLVVHRGVREVEQVSVGPHLHAARSDLTRFRGTIRDFQPDAFVDVPAGTRSEAEAVVHAITDDIRFIVLSSMDVYRAYGSLLAGKVTDALPLNETAAVRTERYIHRGRRIRGLREARRGGGLPHSRSDGSTSSHDLRGARLSAPRRIHLAPLSSTAAQDTDGPRNAPLVSRLRA